MNAFRPSVFAVLLLVAALSFAPMADAQYYYGSGYGYYPSYYGNYYGGYGYGGYGYGYGYPSYGGYYGYYGKRSVNFAEAPTA
uniref:Secreted protein ir p9.6 n=1 Tax=Steinernema glaseri TaxID=37863 RepID=A0A1I7Y546_9BILA